jgi:D-alanyl-D-alanine dipeptidase
MVEVTGLGNVRVKLRYATTHNFMKENMYCGVGEGGAFELDEAYLAPECFEKLKTAAMSMRTRLPQYDLVIYDALRPNSVQKKMKDWARSEKAPEKIRLHHQNYVGEPFDFSKKDTPQITSMHLKGLAVDLTLDLKPKSDFKPPGGLHPDGGINMGTEYDYFYECAGRKASEIADCKMTPGQLANRKTLSDVMIKGGLVPNDDEWWHFDCGDKASPEIQKIIPVIQ